MSELTIEFQQMFLLVNRTNGATVLIPSERHTATITGSMLVEPIQLSRADVIVRRDGADLADLPTLRPGARYLPYLNYVFHSSVTPLPEAKNAAVPSNLNARVLLAGGYLTELPASDARVAEVIWNFEKPNQTTTLRQPLTDRLLFTLPLDEGVKYELIIRAKGQEQSWPIPADGASLTILNADNEKKRHAIDGVHRLVEYSILYNLTSASEFVTLYPIPTADTNSVGGGDQPICGGGQTDGEDDPPPPPPPPPADK